MHSLWELEEVSEQSLPLACRELALRGTGLNHRGCFALQSCRTVTS
jgi:hypothetical protein